MQGLLPGLFCNMPTFLQVSASPVCYNKEFNAYDKPLPCRHKWRTICRAVQ